jgi:hypothetical protein
MVNMINGEDVIPVCFAERIENNPIWMNRRPTNVIVLLPLMMR